MWNEMWNATTERRFRAWELVHYGWNMPWLAWRTPEPGTPLLLVSGKRAYRRHVYWRFVGKQLDEQLTMNGIMGQKGIGRQQ